jgi:hypothetical protein
MARRAAVASSRIAPPRKFSESSRPENEIGVGHRRLGAASAIGRRPGIGSGTTRADAKSAGSINIGDRAAAGADRVDIDHRRQHRVAADPRVAGGSLGKTPVDDDADIGRGAADIEGDQAIASRQPTAPGAPKNAGSRSREQRQHRGLRDGCRCGDAAIGAHHVQIGGEAFVAEAARQPRHVVAQARPDEGVEQSRGKALELAELRRHLGRGADEAIGELLARDVARPLLMRCVQVREQEADRYRLDTGGAKRSRRLAHRSLVERSQYLAARWRQALGDREAMPALDQRPILPGNFLPDRIMLRTLVASDVDDIAIAGSRNHASDRPVIFQHGIGADRRAVQHMVDRLTRQVEACAQGADPGDHAARRVVLCRRRLVDQGPAGFRVGKNDVREGAADIDADQVHTVLILPGRRPSQSFPGGGALQ